MTWALACLSLASTLANVRKMRVCFAGWFVTNVSWAVVDFRAGLHAQGGLMCVYAALAVWGFFAWKR